MFALLTNWRGIIQLLRTRHRLQQPEKHNLIFIVDFSDQNFPDPESWYENVTNRHANKVLSVSTWIATNKRFHPFSLRDVSMLRRQSKTITQREASADNIEPRTIHDSTHEVGRKLMLCYFFLRFLCRRTDSGMLSPSVRCWGVLCENIFLEPLRRLNSVEFFVDVGRRFSLLPTSESRQLWFEVKGLKLLFKVNF